MSAGAELPRADRPAEAPARGFFAFADSHLRGLDYVFWAFLLYLFVSVASLDEEWPQIARFRPRLILGGLVLLAATARLALAAFASKRGPAPPNATAAWWGVYVAATMLASVWAYDFALAKDALLDGRLQALLFFLLILVLVGTRRQFAVVVLVFCLAYGIYLVRSFQEFFAGRMYAKAEGVRMVGMGDKYADPNSFAATLAFSLPLVLWAGLYTRSWLLRACVAAYGVLSVIAVVLTKSRAGLILLVLVSVYFVLAIPSRRWRIAAVLFLLVGAAVGSTFLPERTRDRYVSILTGGRAESDRESTMGRIEGYQIAYRIFREHPVLGIGPGNWSTYRMKKIDGDTMMPHNLGGQLIATLGLVGTAAFALYLLSAAVAGFSLRRRLRESEEPWNRATRAFAGAMLFSLVLLFVSGLAAHNVGRENWYWAPALMLAAAACRPERGEPSREKAP